VAVCRVQTGFSWYNSAISFARDLFGKYKCFWLSSYPEVCSWCTNVPFLCICTYMSGCSQKCQYQRNVHGTVNTQLGWIICGEPGVRTCLSRAAI